MLQTRINQLLQFLFWAAILAILILSLADLSDTPVASTNDKLNHLLAFFSLSLLAALAYPKTELRYQAGALLSYGLLIEILQAGLSYRDFSLLDVVADSAGIAAFAAARWVAIQGNLKKQTISEGK